MPFPISMSSTSSQSSDCDTDITLDDIKAKLEQGENFSGTDISIDVPLPEIENLGKIFDNSFELPPILNEMIGSNTAPVTILAISVKFSAQKPAFNIGIAIPFNKDFYEGLDIPDELQQWFAQCSTGITLSYEKGANATVLGNQI